MLFRLLESGRRVELVDGNLVIYKPSGELVAPKAFKQHIPAIAKELCLLLSIDVFQFRPKHKTGLFGGHKGVLCQFERMRDGEEMYAFFNANLVFQRSTTYHQQGDALPYGLGQRFDLPPRSPLLKLCKQVGIFNKPSEIYKSLGKLSTVFCSAKEHPEKPGKLVSKSFKAISIPYETIVREFQRLRSTSSLLSLSNYSTTTFDKDLPETLVIHGYQGKSNTCDRNYVYKDISTKDIPIYLHNHKTNATTESERVKLQTMDEWLDELGPALDDHNRSI